MPDIYVSEQRPGETNDDTPKKAGEVTSLARTRRHYHPLASFMERPKNVCVEVQESDEEVLLLVRRHPITNVRWILIVLIMIVASLFFPVFPVYDVLPARFQMMTYLLWYLFTFAVALQGFFNWYFDTFVITDERVIDIDFNNLIYKNITSAKIDRVEDVTYSVSGFLPSILNYGNVLIQTAGEVIGLKPEGTLASIEMYETPNPARIVQLLNELILQEEQEKIEGRVK